MGVYYVAGRGSSRGGCVARPGKQTLCLRVRVSPRNNDFADPGRCMTYLCARRVGPGTRVGCVVCVCGCVCVWGGGGGGRVRNLIFYAQSTNTVISG